MKICIDYDGSDMVITCDDGRSVVVTPQDNLDGIANAYRKLQEIHAVVEGICTVTCKLKADT